MIPLPPPPTPDTHCFDDDTGKDVWSHSAEQMQAYALAAIEARLNPKPKERCFEPRPAPPSGQSNQGQAGPWPS